MPYVQQGIIVGLVLLVTGMAWAGGSNYGITPGSRPQVEGKIREGRGAAAQICPRSGAWPGWQHLYFGHAWEQDRALRYPHADVSRVGPAGRSTTAWPAGRPQWPGVVHGQRQRHYRAP